jgi:very-short-patch-repair endonuclease
MAETICARQLRKKETWAEKLVWRWLRDRRFSSYKFRRQHPLGDYSLDFFCEEAELAIELDGGQHGCPDQQAHDAEREEFLKSRALRRFAFGIRNCGAMHRVFAIRFSTSCKSARRILCRIIRGL